MWQRPDPPNGLIINYTVSIKILCVIFSHCYKSSQVSYYPKHQNVDNNNEVSITVDVDNQYISLFFLLPNVEYHISVTAYTRVGSGAVAILLVTTSTITDSETSMHVIVFCGS